MNNDFIKSIQNSIEEAMSTSEESPSRYIQDAEIRITKQCLKDRYEEMGDEVETSALHVTLVREYIGGKIIKGKVYPMEDPHKLVDRIVKDLMSL